LRRDEGEQLLVGARIGHGEPWVDLLALPLALFGAFLFSSTTFGRLLAVPVQIQFHELGHALTAWLASRAALPLPFGFTFWREERSTFTALCVLFLLGVLLVRASRERRPFGVLLSTLLFGLWAWLSCSLANQQAERWILAGGVAGEFVLSALAMLAFFFRLPDRLRWDFFRFLVLAPAALAWVSSTRLWVGVARGTQPLPLGSILGSPGDLSGDLERLMMNHGVTAAAITHGYLTLCVASGALWSASYAIFALRALRKLHDARAVR
jgi:hypothetical protein